MSKQSAPSASRVGADEKSSTGVIDAEAPEAIPETDHAQIKKQQKSRLHDLDRETLTGILHQMLLVRRFEEKAAEAYSMGKIGGFCHLYIGQEAVAIGASRDSPDDTC